MNDKPIWQRLSAYWKKLTSAADPPKPPKEAKVDTSPLQVSAQVSRAFQPGGLQEV